MCFLIARSPAFVISMLLSRSSITDNVWSATPAEAIYSRHVVTVL